MTNFCKLLFAVLLFLFVTFKLFFSDTLFPLPKSKIKNGTSNAVCVTRKLKWKFDIRDPWLVIFLVREQCHRTPPPRFPACTTLFLPNISGRMDTNALSTTIGIFLKPHILYTQKMYQRIIICHTKFKNVRRYFHYLQNSLIFYLCKHTQLRR